MQARAKNNKVWPNRRDNHELSNYVAQWKCDPPKMYVLYSDYGPISYVLLVHDSD
jgi:hypothetical protein